MKKQLKPRGGSPYGCKDTHEVMESLMGECGEAWMGHIIFQAVTNPGNPDRQLFLDTLQELGITISSSAMKAGEQNYHPGVGIWCTKKKEEA